MEGQDSKINAGCPASGDMCGRPKFLAPVYPPREGTQGPAQPLASRENESCLKNSTTKKRCRPGWMIDSKGGQVSAAAPGAVGGGKILQEDAQRRRRQLFHKKGLWEGGDCPGKNWPIGKLIKSEDAGQQREER